MNFKTFLIYATLHSIKISYIVIILITAIGLLFADKMPSNNSYFVNLLFYSGLLCICRLVFGGWSSSSIKGMIWQVVMSSIGSLLIMIAGMGYNHGNVSFWPIIVVLIISIIIGVICHNFIEDLLTNSTNFELDDIVDSVFSNGLKNTFNGIMDIFEGNAYYAASRGVAAYSNTVLILGIIIAFCYM